MKRECEVKHPLIRDGAGREDRLLDALNPQKASFPKIDDRTLADLLAFARSYAEKIQYYNLQNEPAGDWASFFENDVSFLIAQISLKDLAPFKTLAQKALSVVEAGPHLKKPKVKKASTTLFDLIFTMAWEFDRWYKRSVPGFKFERELVRIISAQLKQPLFQALGNYKFARDKNFLADEPLAAGDTALLSSEDVLAESFETIWTDGESWSDYIDGITYEKEIFQSKPGTAADGLRLLFEPFCDAQSQLKQLAPDLLKETLESWSGHEPHAALYLTFLRLFEHAQNHLNTITQRRLDFFYRQVLGFKEKPAVPDTVHLLFELAKQIDSHTLDSGTLLKAGKDSSDKDVFYATDSEISINKASVASLKTVFVDSFDACRVYAARAANSLDGQGAVFEIDEPKWKPFGQSQKNLAASEQTMVRADIGFAVAAPVLFLSEGTRDIFLTLTSDQSISAVFPTGAAAAQKLSIYLSGAEAWIQKTPAEFKKVGDKKLQIKISLDVSDPPVAAYDDKVLTEGFSTPFPVLKVVLKNEEGQAYLYEHFKELDATGIDIEVDVKGVASLILQNDEGLNAKFPFGTRPAKGAHFHIGNREVFQKQLTYLKWYLEWKDVPDSDMGEYYESYFLTPAKASERLLALVMEEKEKLVQETEEPKDAKSVFEETQSSSKREKESTTTLSNTSFKAQCEILYGNEWKALGDPKSLFKSSDATQVASAALVSSDFSKLSGYAPDYIENDFAQYSVDTGRGFIRLALSGPDTAFGHRLYREIYTKRIIAYANSQTAENELMIPNEPYTPLLNSLTLDYKAKESVDLSQKPTSKSAALFHVRPFGHKAVFDETGAALPAVGKFQNGEKDDVAESQGELYIGVSGLKPRQTLSLLFQVAEGSADPELSKETIYWSYLADNQWKSFSSKEILGDSTNGLLNSGIMLFDVSKAATDDNTVLPSGFHWIRACVRKNAAAVCDVIEIAAQAVAATFQDQKNDPGFLATPTPANTISKLKVKQSAVKKIKQPYASFGGKVEERSPEFYTRVSERLRHKGRGVGPWDYERLVLENFPEIYKARCISHATYNYADEERNIEIPASEFAPGFVTVIVIPDLNNLNAVNPLEPRASLATLEKVKSFLSERISPFAAKRLKVINPLYEQVRVSFQFAPKGSGDSGVYETRLNDDIKRFLSPWAYGKSADISFGGKIHRSTILNFVEERPYVDYVVDFTMSQIVENQETGSDIEEAAPGTARSIIVSHPDHDIKALEKGSS